MSGFIDVTGLFTNGSELVSYDYCVPVDSIRDVVNDTESGQTVIRYESEIKGITALAVAEDYATILNKIRAANNVVA